MEAPPEIILQIIGFSIFMVILSMIMNKKYMLSQEAMMAQQERMQMLQEKLMKAQRFNNIELFQEAQAELANEMKELMRKQMIPMCVRTLVFLGMFGLLGLLYGQYDSIFPFPILFFGKGWAAVYILTSLGLSLLIALFKKIFKKGTTQQPFVDIAGIRSGMMNLSMNQMTPMNSIPPTNKSTADPPLNSALSNDEEKIPEWKKKMNAEESNQQTNKESQPDNIPEWKRKLQSQ
jgi:uncharacterized membrane protein (DUF106 family)